MTRILILIAAASLAACVGPTPYQPRADEGGFAETKIETNRYRVVFAGNSQTSREVVETYLLHRAAEVTLEAGGDWFEIVGQDTEIDRKIVSTGHLFPGPFLFSRHRRRGFGYGFAGAGFGTVSSRAVDRYDAHAEIIVHRGEKPAERAEAYDAREVVANLGPTLRLPESE